MKKIHLQRQTEELTKTEMLEETISVVSTELVMEKEEIYSNTIDSSESAANIIDGLFRLSKKAEEYCILLCLGTKNNINHAAVISKGTINTSMVHPREIFKVAILSNANSIIIAHNHPSGNIEPSNADIQTTKRIKDAGELIGIQLIDSLIIGKNNHLSIIGH